MKKYIDYLMEYSNIPSTCDTFKQIIDKVNEKSISRIDNPTNNAVLVLGYSGNGKTTIINEFLNIHPEYIKISIDVLCKFFISSYKRFPSLMELQSLFGQLLEEYKGQNIILDGNFLNLFNRMALCDYLHANGYNVNMIDLTPNIDEVMPNRIMDETDRLINANGIKQPSVDECAFYYGQASKKISDFYMEERRRAFMDDQEKHNTIHMGADKVFGMKDNLEDVNNIFTPNLN